MLFYLIKKMKKYKYISKKLIEKYCVKNNEKWENHFALWNFIEILTFSKFIKFYKFYYKETKLQKYNFIEEIAKLRNASAHNFCILNNFKYYNDFSFKPSKSLQSKIRALSIFNKNKKLKYLKNPLYMIVYVYYFLLKNYAL
ncbi:Abi family protein [Campylobacter novaezeelandiae]|nr:Abi family protein [Campylobacter novaezeelandiae]